MSETGTTKRPRGQAEPGSRMWFWQMRILNIHLWITPLTLLAVAAVMYRTPGVENPSVGERMMFSLPWIAVAVGAGALAYALWRIEVNMEGGKRPFTQKDEMVYKRATIVQIVLGGAVMLSFLVIIFYVLIHQVLVQAEPESFEDQFWPIINAMYPPLGAIYLVGMFTQTLKRVHTKARAYYEELEEGV
jgi:hypothetical protein